MVPRVMAGTLGGETIWMTQGESVECLCSTDFICLTMEMDFGGMSSVLHFTNSIILPRIIDLFSCQSKLFQTMYISFRSGAFEDVVIFSEFKSTGAHRRAPLH